MRPDFLITPYEVKVCPGLRPTDGDVYAVVYWFEHLKDGKCTAANETIADVLECKARTVRAALERLEKKGFIRREFAEDGGRMEIKTMVRFAKVEEARAQKRGQQKLIDGPTPGQIAREFFDVGSTRRMEIVDQIASETGAPREAIVSEAKKFYVYWTEPNKSGTKVKWELERTFDVKRRLYTWLSRAGTYGKRKTAAGSGITV